MAEITVGKLKQAKIEITQDNGWVYNMRMSVQRDPDPKWGYDSVEMTALRTELADWVGGLVDFVEMVSEVGADNILSEGFDHRSITGVDVVRRERFGKYPDSGGRYAHVDYVILSWPANVSDFLGQIEFHRWQEDAAASIVAVFQQGNSVIEVDLGSDAVGFGELLALAKAALDSTFRLV